MTPIKTLEYITDKKGIKRKVLLNITDFERLQEEVMDLEDSLTMEKAKREATGFKKWHDFVREVEAQKSN